MHHNSFPCDIVSKNHLLEKYCTPVQKLFLNKSAICTRQKKDDIIFHEHFPATQIYFVLSGVVGLWKENIYLKKQYIRFIKEGELFGFRGSSMENISSYRLSASAFEDAQICQIPKEDFAHVLKENPALHLNILLTYVKELEKIEQSFCHQASMNTREKVAEALLTIHKAFGCNGNGAPFCKKVLRGDIADIAGISTGKTINLLSEFRAENIIATCGSTITMLQPDKLKEIVAEYHQ
ncbi:MAG: Crp/Fnr family transcriptional regulator [Bacteroidetes bacterium]|nr:Crp/Fnr family transcriptional regulator [Bacteroidota bacterium]